MLLPDLSSGARPARRSTAVRPFLPHNAAGTLSHLASREKVPDNSSWPGRLFGVGVADQARSRSLAFWAGAHYVVSKGRSVGCPTHQGAAPSVKVQGPAASVTAMAIARGAHDGSKSKPSSAQHAMEQGSAGSAAARANSSPIPRPSPADHRGPTSPSRRPRPCRGIPDTRGGIEQGPFRGSEGRALLSRFIRISSSDCGVNPAADRLAENPQLAPIRTTK
jgi:hypothetical protein